MLTQTSKTSQQKTKRWVYTGLELGIDFSDLPIPEGEECNIPDHLKPTDEMQERFCRNMAEHGIMALVD